MSLNVFEPVIVKAPAPPWLSVQLNVEPAPIKVLALAPVMEIVPTPVPAVVVKVEGFKLRNAVVLLPVTNKVPPLKVKFVVPVAVTNLVPAVQEFPFKFNVPFVIFTAELAYNALPSDQLPPAPSNKTETKETPLVVTVLPVVVALNVVVPVYVRVKFVA